MPLFTPELEFTDDYPTIEPSLRLDFANARALDPRITFTRASVGTYVGRDGLIKTVGNDEPRFDHDPATGESLGLLIEESRINFIASSETTFSGTATGDFFRGKEIHNKSVNLNGFYFGSQFQNYNIQAGDKYFLTGFIRAGSQTGSITIRWIDGFNGPIPAVNNFTYTPTTDGEFVSFEFTFTAGVNITMNIALSGTFGDDADFAIMQFEKGSFPTSYIPTSGSTVTRGQEKALISGESFNSFFNPTEGFVMGTYKLNGINTGSNWQTLVTMDDNTANNRLWIYARGGGDSTQWIGSSGGTTQFAPGLGATATAGVERTIGGAYALNDAIGVYGGTLTANDTTVVLPVGVDRMGIGFRDDNDSGFINGTIKKLIYYPKRLTNAQLQTLTQ
jgi:hypothetical protein